MGMLCYPLSKEITDQQDRYIDLEKIWNGEHKQEDWKNIRNRYGKLAMERGAHPLSGEGTAKNKDVKSFGYKMLDEIAMDVLQKPFDPFLPITTSQYKRLKIRLSRLDRDLANEKFGWFDSVFKVKQAVANRYPEVSYLVNKLSKAGNYERNQNVMYVTGIDKVSKRLTAALLEADANLKGLTKAGKAGSFMKEMDDLWDGLLTARFEGDTGKMKEVNKRLEEVAGKHADGVIKKLLTYVEKNEIVDENGKRISSNIIKAGDEMRLFFNDMGEVTVRGLQESINTLGILYFGRHNPTGDQVHSTLGKRWLRFKKDTGELIKIVNEKREQNTPKGIEKLKKEGKPFEGYFPHYLITEFSKLRDSINQVNKLKVAEGETREDVQLKSLKGIEDIIQNFGDTGVLQRARGRLIKEGLDNAWNKNPLGVMKRYAQDAIAFNKIHHVKSAYLTLVRNIKGSTEDSGLNKKLMGYIEDMYKSTTRGYVDRDPMVNGIVRAITSAEFASKLRLGITSAARNFLSANHYLAAVGYKSWLGAMKTIREDKDLSKRIDAIEQEQGFKFREANLAAITEGLLPTTGVDKNSIEYDEFREEIKFRRHGKWDTVDKSMAKVAGKLALFHAIGENAIRKNMFRTTWALTYKALTESPEFVQSRERGERDVENIATNASLIAVNRYAYEYAAFAKAPAIGGTTRQYGAAGQVLGQFMHYPMSFLNQQWHMLRGAKDSVLAGQYKSPELLASYRYAGIFAFINVLSGAINLDLTHLFENDTAERVKDLINFLAADSDEERELAFHGGGLATQVVGGPFVSDLIFYGNYMGMYRMPENDMAKLVFGYADMYDKTDKEKKARLLSHINVEVGKWINKDWPSIKSENSEEILRHELGLYPRAWTREDFYNKPWGIGKHFGERKSKVGTKYLRQAQKQARRRPAASTFRRTQSEITKLHKAMGIAAE